MAFAASHRFWSVVSLLSFASMYFLISSLISSVIHWLFSTMLFSFYMFVFFAFFFLLLIFLSFFWGGVFFLGPHLWHVEVPKLGVNRAVAASLCHSHSMPDPSFIWDLYHSSWQCWILNTLSKARD